MYPRRLVLKNFGPFESFDYNFVHEPIAVIGENRTQDDQMSNGSGKSFMEQGLFYGMYGANLRGREDKKLIRKGFDSSYICVEIQCPIRESVLRIEREIRMKGSSTLRLTLIDKEENCEQVNFATILDGNRFVANWLEISPEDAKSYYIISKGNYKSFFTSSNTEKLALISRFINFSNIDKTKDVITKLIEGLNEEKQGLVRTKSMHEGKLLVYNEQIEELMKKDPEKEREDLIQSLNDSIETYKQEIISYKKKIQEYTNDINLNSTAIKEYKTLQEKVQKELDSLDFSSFDITYKEIEKDLKGIQEDKALTEKEQSDLLKKKRNYKIALNNIETLLAGVITCPNCHHKFLLENDKGYEELNKEKDNSLKEIKKLEDKEEELAPILEDLENVIAEYAKLRKETEVEELQSRKQQREIRSKLTELMNDIFQLENENTSYENQIKKYKNSITTNEEMILHKKESIDNIINQPIEDIDTSSIEEHIAQSQSFIRVSEKQILNVDDRIFKKQAWVQRFKDFKMFLAMEQLKNIQIGANEILKLMGSDLRLMIEGFKRDAKGNTKEEITPYVFRDEMESFFFYSGGEQSRVEIALILALQQMINSTKKYGGLQFLLVDEVLESCDALGIENVISSMSFLEQPIVVITHVPKINEEIRQVKIIKENDVSRLEE